MKSQDGKTIAVGDLTNVVRGDQIHSELVFHFSDGSIDDEVADFRQDAAFELIRDHHIQKGPSYPRPLDLTIDVENRQATWLEVKDGKSEAHTDHIDAPADLANGMIQLVVENFQQGASEWKTSYLAADPKPRVVQLSFKPDGEDRVRIGGASRKVVRYNLHVDIGGIKGALAPVAGKQPSDIKLWVLPGSAPVLVKMVGALYPEGPMWTMVLTSPIWPPTPPQAK